MKLWRTNGKSAPSSNGSDSRTVQRYEELSPGAADGVTLLTYLLLLLYILPARLVLGPLGAIGRPAALFGLALFGWWMLSRIGDPTGMPTNSHPLRKMLFAYLVVLLVSYTFGIGRGLPPSEASGADRTLLTLTGATGIALVAMDGCRTRACLDVLLKRLTAIGSVFALAGVIQFFFGYNIAQQIRVPGLVLNQNIADIGERGDEGYRRVASTAPSPDRVRCRARDAASYSVALRALRRE